jgi:hypothetical protein
VEPSKSRRLAAWIPPAALSANPTGTAAASCSDTIKQTIAHRRSFGYDFNAPPHDQTDGTAITVNPACGAASAQRKFRRRTPRGCTSFVLRTRP